jgi:hypothetical protein
LIDGPIEKAPRVAEQIVRLVRLALVGDALNHCAHFTGGDVGDRSVAPQRDKDPANVALDFDALRFACQLRFDEIFGHSGERVALAP